MNHKIFLYVTGLFLTLGMFISLSQAFAQDGINDSDITPGTTGTIINETNNVTSTTSDDRFSPLWILPLIAIPILLYMLWPRRRDETAIDSDHHLAGAKGGRSKEETDENYKPEPPRYRDEH